MTVRVNVAALHFYLRLELSMKALVVSVVIFCGIAVCGGQETAITPQVVSSTDVKDKTVSGPFSNEELLQFTSLDPIDTHTHVFVSNPAFGAMLKRLNLHLLDIVLVDDQNPHLKDLFAESTAARRFVHGSEGRAALCTTFDPYRLNERGFTEASIRAVDQEFNQGAIAVKIWKNIGMEIKDSSGRYILPDNPLFEPIYKDIDFHGKTLIAHVADPSSSWSPENPASPDYSYYKEHPVWYMFNKSHPASREEILQARDHILEEHPNLRVVGAHLGSMEADFGQLSQHLDRYPNFAVDLAGRMPYLMLQPPAGVIAFIVKYQDRLIYATDNDLSPNDDIQQKIGEWEESYARDWRFLATDDTLDYRGKAVKGLALPNSILRKLFHDNATRWFPGILREFR